MKETIAPAARAVKADIAKAIESQLATYNPDDEFRPKQRRSLVGSFLEFLKGKKVDPIESATIIEVNRLGAYRLRKIEGTEQFRAALSEAAASRAALNKIIENGVKLRPLSSIDSDSVKEMREIAKTKKFREDFAVDNSNTRANPFDEYIPIMGGPFSHQLYLHDFLDMLAKSFEAWNHNPLAHQIVKITTHFVLGRGVTFKAKDPRVQKRFAQWWDKNKMAERLEFWCDMLSRDGELMIRHHRHPITKEMGVRWVDPSTVWEIVTDLEDIETVYYYHQQYPCAYQVLYGAGADKRFDPTNFGSSKYVINQIPANEIYHVKINCSPNEKRGRSDLFSILGWLKRYKDFQTAVVLRAIGQSTLIWKNKLTGANTDIQAFINAFGSQLPEFGTMWVENEASTLSPMMADTSSGGQIADCPGIVNAIATGSGIPKEYLGLSEHGTRATAVVASEPGVKKFQSRQLLLGRLLKDLAQEWVANEIVTGGVPAIGSDGKPTDGGIEFEFPEIAIEDRSAKIKDIQSAELSGYITRKRAATMAAKELGIEAYDPDVEQEEIAAEGIDKMRDLYPPQPNPVIDALKPDPQPAPSGSLSGQDRRDIKLNDRR